MSAISWLEGFPNEACIPYCALKIVGFNTDRLDELIEELEEAGAWFYDSDMDGWVPEPHWGIPVAFRERGPVDEESLLLRDGWSCAHCGATCAALQVDHIVPFSSGGSDALPNLQWLCPPCNISKGSRPMNEWRASDLGRQIIRNDCALGICGHDSSARLRRLAHTFKKLGAS